jgi:putative ABC transport system ATP-binding protein
MSNLLINCQNISKHYRMGDVIVDALREINLQIKHGEYLAILGPSGSGKTTLMHILGCLDNPSSGEYFLNNKNVSNLSRNELARIRNQEIGFVFQNFNLLARADAIDNVALPLVYRGVSTAERQQRATKILQRIGLGNRLHHLPNELSGGQRQRVAIARALITEPDVILADEPTGNLDSRSGQEIIRLFEELTAEKKTVILVTHDVKLAERTRRIVQIQDGVITSDALRA